MHNFRLYILRHLATGVEAKLPLHRALQTSAKEAPSVGLREDLEKIAGDLQSGTSLDAALARCPWFFSQGDLLVIHFAQENGRLAEVLRLMVIQDQQQRRRNQTIKVAWFIPLLELSALGGILTFLSIFILPKFTQIFRDLTPRTVSLPPAFEFALGVGVHPFLKLLAVGSVLASILLVFACFCSAASLILPGYYYGYAKYLVTDLVDELFPPVTEFWLARYSYLRVPFFYELGRERFTMQFCGYMELFLAAQLPADEALHAAAGATPIPRLRARLAQAQEAIHQGLKLSDALAKSRLFPDTALWFLRNGEARGELGRACGQAADFYAVKVESRSQWLHFWINPLATVFVGILVGIFCHGIFSAMSTILRSLFL